MNRPRRSAAEKAREMIARGFGIDQVEETEVEGLPPEDEDELDLELCGSPGEEEEMDEMSEDDRRKSARNENWKTYSDEDVCPKIPEFKPRRPVGPYLMEHATRHGANMFCQAFDVFSLFFNAEMMEALCNHTNTYAWLHILDKPSYGRTQDGSWKPVTIQEMYSFLAIIICMGFISLPTIARYWCTTPPYCNGWISRLMSRNKFKAIMGFLHVSDPSDDTKDDKLCKLQPLLRHVKVASRRLLQASREISVDERMVRSKSRSGIRQYMPQKPTRFGFKLWCLCETRTGYTLDFNIYTGRRETPGLNGLAFDVVETLMTNYIHQGYKLFMDNFYTSIPLLKDLRQKDVLVCGTTLQWRKGFPQALRDKAWQKAARRGDMRYVRSDDILCLQWMDTRPVCVSSTYHVGHKYVLVKRNLKDPNDNYRPIFICKPEAVFDYNKGMGAVDLSDQLLERYSLLIKSRRWWKTLFFHLLDLAILNSHILFRDWRSQHPDQPLLSRPLEYSHLHFREELVRQLVAVALNDELFNFAVPMLQPDDSVYISNHIPVITDRRRNCKICFCLYGKEKKTKWICPNAACNIGLCMTAERNCMVLWHTAAFNARRQEIIARYRRT